MLSRGFANFLEIRQGQPLHILWQKLSGGSKKSIEERVKNFSSHCGIRTDEFDGITWMDASLSNVLYDRENDKLTFLDFEVITTQCNHAVGDNELWKVSMNIEY